MLILFFNNLSCTVKQTRLPVPGVKKSTESFCVYKKQRNILLKEKKYSILFLLIGISRKNISEPDKLINCQSLTADCESCLTIRKRARQICAEPRTSPNIIMKKFYRDEDISIAAIMKICECFGCNFGDNCDFVHEKA